MGFFFSSRGEDYAKESEQKVTIDSTKHEKHTKDKEENNSANTVFFDKINDLLVASVKEFEGTVGISYLDLETGEQRSVNGQHEFYTASTIKSATDDASRRHGCFWSKKMDRPDSL